MIKYSNSILSRVLCKCEWNFMFTFPWLLKSLCFYCDTRRCIVLNNEHPYIFVDITEGDVNVETYAFFDDEMVPMIWRLWCSLLYSIFSYWLSADSGSTTLTPALSSNILFTLIPVGRNFISFICVINSIVILWFRSSRNIHITIVLTGITIVTTNIHFIQVFFCCLGGNCNSLIFQYHFYNLHFVKYHLYIFIIPIIISHKWFQTIIL